MTDNVTDASKANAIAQGWRLQCEEAPDELATLRARVERLQAFSIKPGDVVTIAGCYRVIPNPARRWWQIWKPRTVPGPDLARFTLAEEKKP